MTTEWKKVKISSVCEGIYDGPHATPPISDTGFIFLGISNITEDGHLDLSSPKYINERDFPRWTKRVTPYHGDIVFSYEATLNLYAIIPENFKGCLGRRMALIRPNLKKIDRKFLFYYFFSPEWRNLIFTNTITGATVDRISLINFPNFEISLPPLETQQKIAGILSAYDDLIENNRKQIKLLEEAAQKLYKEWFVKLNFPGHENVKILDGVPEGWKKEKLGNLLPIVTGKKDANYGTKDGKYPFFTCSQEPIKAPDFSFDANAILLAGNGDLNVKIYRGQFEAYQRTYVLVPYENKYLFICYRTIQDNLRKLVHGASGSTIKFITKGMIENIEMLIPNDEILLSYNNLSEPVLSKIEVLQSQIQHLQSARDKLLPTLMKGDIDV